MNAVTALLPFDPSTLLAWVVSYLVHSTLLMALALLVARYDVRLEESLWRLALLGTVGTATLQSLTGAALWRLPSSGAASPLPQTGSPPAPGATPIAAPASAALSAAELLVILWLAIATVLTVRWIGARLRLHRELASRVACDDPVLLAEIDQLADAAGLGARPRLTVSEVVPGPIAFGWREPEICLPPRLDERLAPAERRAVMAHEIAHLRRRDSVWLGLVQLAGSLLFFQPLFGIARRRLAQLAELACDRWSAAVSGSGLPLARGLTEVARWRLAGTDGYPVPGLAVRRSGLARRVDALLGKPTAPSLPRWLRHTLTMCALLLVVVVTPGLTTAAQEPPPPPPPEEEAPPAIRYPTPPPLKAPAHSPAPPAPPSEAPLQTEMSEPPGALNPPDPPPHLRRLEAGEHGEVLRRRLEERLARAELERRAQIEALEASRRIRLEQLGALDQAERDRIEDEIADRMAELHERLERSEAERRARLEALTAQRRAHELDRFDVEERARLQAEMAARMDELREGLDRSEAERRARLEALTAQRRVRELEARARTESRDQETSRELRRDDLERRREILERQRERLRLEQETLELELERLEAADPTEEPEGENG